MTQTIQPASPQTLWRYRLTVLVIIALGVILHRDAFRSPFVSDDLAQRAMLHGEFPSRRSPLDLYDFADGTPADHQRLLDAGALPWWAAPRVKFAFVRPLSSALIALDDACFGTRALPSHVHSFLWYAAMLAALAALVRSLFGVRIALLAVLFFALDESLTWGVVWAANRNAIISVTFAALAIRGYVRTRESPGTRTRDRVLVACLFALSLAAGEVGVCMLAYVAGFELFTARGPWSERIRASLVWLGPLCALALAYVVFHFGAAGSDTYVSPLAQPIAYLRLASPRYVALLGDVLFARPYNSTAITPRVVITLAFALAFTAWFVWRAARRAPSSTRSHLPWLAFGTFTAMAPTFGSIITERIALPSELGVSVIAAFLVCDGIAALARRDEANAAPLARLARIAIAAVVLVIHLGVAPRRTHEATRVWADFSSTVARSVAESDVARTPLHDATIVLLSAIEPSTFMYIPQIWHLHGAPMPREYRLLAYTPSALILHRPETNVLDVYIVDDVWMTTAGERLYRSANLPFHAGDVVTMRGFSATILTMGHAGPRLVRFRFDRSLDDPKMIICISTLFGIIRVPPPLVGANGYVPPPQLPIVSQRSLPAAR